MVDLESQTVMQLVYIAEDYSPMRGHQKARPFKKEKYIIITNTCTHTHTRPLVTLAVGESSEESGKHSGVDTLRAM